MKKTLIASLLALVLTTFTALGTTTGSVVWSFTNAPDGRVPQAGLAFGVGKNQVYGTATFGGYNGSGILYTVVTNGTGYTILDAFTNNVTSGTVPVGLGFPIGQPVIIGTSIYAIASSGGTYDSVYGRYYADGGIVSDSTNGTTLASLKNFGTYNSDGKKPVGDLIVGADGSMYGVTRGGGLGGVGTVYQLSASGTYTILHQFLNNGDGCNPVGGLVQEAATGKLYGTTEQGGTYGKGTIFTVTTNGTGYSVLYNFLGGTTDGAAPHGALVQSTNALLYGTCSSACTNGYGALFSINTNGTGEAIIHAFAGGSSDGAQPDCGLAQRASDELIFGTTSYGGSAHSYGTVFEIGGGGASFSQIWNFTNSSDGEIPSSTPLVGSEGALYLTTSQGGTAGFGAVERIVP